MKIYIAGTSAISPNQIAENSDASSVPANNESEYLRAVEPDYKDFVDPKLSRRMARIIKMSIAGTKICLQNAGVEDLGAIVIGTGLGCLHDTEKFLKDMLDNEEKLLSPTAFIQSTHNTIAGQIALVLNNQQYNFTYCQKGHSFENALQDACLQIEEGNDNVLVGGVDEVTPSAFEILYSLNCVSKRSQRPEKFTSMDYKPVLGEGAAFFVLTSSASSNSRACLEGVEFFFGANSIKAIEIRILKFIEKLGVNFEKIDAVMMGYNGYQKEDLIYSEIAAHIFGGKSILTFKNICGEYFTASAFGLHLASEVLKNQCFTDEIFLSGIKSPKLNYILLYNHYNEKYHSLMLLSRCQNS